MSNIDFSELIISKKGVITKENLVVGNVIGERNNSIIVEKDQASSNVFIIPKTKVSAFDGAQIILEVNESELNTFEEKKAEYDKNKMDKTIDSVTDTISEKIDNIKEKALETKDKLADKTKVVSKKK